ncbi:hypothetical protein [Cylindrospermopsis raciborskii]|uniref:Uncharacterized protein n=1 Tax=Cylindrospermopsis raciborskii CS-505 TaxID=533240 RepID=A0A853MFQ2_9CYAN|nr:hypothetical protein [Cylindrospermopsis raciborskii]EFA71494.1 conserved hypothetical protein [Cylindrospermopsis raciborskii CS-505]OBU77195.1 hypothetical protein A9P98_13600 [Cylindrospermopsis raciborskii CS-505]
MLKPKSLIFTLSLVPFLLASLQLTSEGGSTTPGGPSGNILPSPPSIPTPEATNPGPQPGPPNPGPQPEAPNPPGKRTPGGFSGGSGVTFIPNAESIIVTKQGQSATLAVTQEVQSALNQIVPNIVQVLGTSANTTDLVTLVLARPGVTEAAARITAALTSAGISPQLAIALVNALNGLFSPSTASSPGAMLVSTKDWKGNNTVAQAGAAFSVNIDKLSAAITAYNGIVIESKPPTLKRLSQDASFVGIGRTLKQLRNAIP